MHRTGGSTRPGPARGALLSVGSLAVVPVVALVSGPLLARVLGPHERGVLAAALAPMFVAMFVAGLALPEAVARAVSGDGVTPRRAAWLGCALAVPLAAAVAGGLALVAPALLRGTPEAVSILRHVLPLLPLLTATLVIRAAWGGDGAWGRIAVERVCSAGGRLILLVALALTGTLTADTAVWANVASTLLAALVLVVPLSRTESGPIRPGLTRSLAGYGGRGALAVCAQLVVWRLDQALLALWLGATQVGYYAVAVGLAQLPATVLGALRPIVLTEAARRRDHAVVARVARMASFVTTVCAVSLAAGAGWLVPTLFGAAFAQAGTAARLLVAGSVPLTVEAVLGAGLLACGRPGLRSVGPAVAAVAMVIGMAVLAPRYGVEGAAAATAGASLLGCVVTVGCFSRVSGVPVVDCLLVRRVDLAWLRASIAGALTRRRGRAEGSSS